LYTSNAGGSYWKIYMTVNGTGNVYSTTYTLYYYGLS
jgi:hypothetical protein